MLTNFTVRWERKVNPAQYESADAAVELVGHFEDCPDANAMATELSNAIATAKHMVLLSLGKIRGPAQDTVKTAETTAAERAANPPVVRDPAELSAAADAAIENLATAGAGPAKRERGKPSPGKQRRTKEEMAEDAAADAADAASAADMGAMDGGDPAAVAGGEDPRPSEVATDPAAMEDWEKDATVSDQDLQSAAAKASRGKGAKFVKDLMAEFGVQRLGSLEQDRRADFVAKLEG